MSFTYSGGGVRRGVLVTSGVTGGDTVQNIGGYRIHTFTTTGTQTFTVSGASITGAQMLVVAGGGGGGQSTNPVEGAAGGGAGGLVYVSSTTLTAGSYIVTVGAGGGVGASGTANGLNGGNSSFSTTYVALGGGGGGAHNYNGSSGGSGGGAGGDNVPHTGGSATQPGSASGGFGNAGGNNNTGTNYSGGGGGGAGAAGSPSISGSGPTSCGGPGGIGLAYSISGTSTYYAGGGAGGDTQTNSAAGGLGGGGAGAKSGTNAQPGTPNTGGGGGGAGSSSLTAAAGGSGIVIIAYPYTATSLTGTPLFSQISQAATSSAVGAFSLRAVNGSSVKAVQVRNGTTSATQDFYADRLGNLLTAPVTGLPLADWLGGATGYVATWYDQSGAGNDATQLTAANQPNIQRATKGPGYMVNFNGTSQFVTLSADSQFLNGTNITVNAVALRTATKATQNWFFGTNTPSVNYQRFQFGFGSDTSISMAITSNPPGITIPAYNASNEPVYYMTGGLIPSRVFYQNDTLGGTNVNSGLLSVPTAYSYSIGNGNQGGVYYYQGNLFELLILTSALDQTQVTQVYQNQLSYTGT